MQIRTTRYHSAAIVASLFPAAALLAVACGGGADTGAGAHDPAAATSVAPAATTAAPVATAKTPAGPTPEEKAKKLAEQHSVFLSSCSQAMPGVSASDSGNYCECGWGELRAKVSDDDIIANAVPDAVQDQVTKSSLDKCGTKISSASLKSLFMEGCAKDSPELKAFCECNFGALEKSGNATLATFVDQVKVKEVTAASVGTCAKTFPDATLRKQILEGCVKGDATRTKKCTCITDVMLKNVSKASIVGGDTTAMDKIKDKLAVCK